MPVFVRGALNREGSLKPNNEQYLSETKLCMKWTDFCLTCLVSRLSFYEDWRFHESLTWWEKGLVGSSSPCLSSCKRGRKKKKNDQKTWSSTKCAYMWLWHSSTNVHLIRELLADTCVKQLSSHAELHNFIEIQVTSSSHHGGPHHVSCFQSRSYEV